MNSPLRTSGPVRCPKLELADAGETEAQTPWGRASLGGQRLPKCWWEAHHLALPICTLAGGPPVARHLAAASKVLVGGPPPCLANLHACWWTACSPSPRGGFQSAGGRPTTLPCQSARLLVDRL